VHLHEDETRKRAFGQYAEAYDAARPRYPAPLFSAVAAHARITPATRALEVGSGTGIATLPFAELGCSIRCLELSDGMAEVARRKLARFPKVAIETTRFEDWTGEDGAFDLVFSAQAWHWIPPEVRYAKAARLLRGGGTLAVFANRDAAVLEEVQPVYRRHGRREIVTHDREAWRESFPPDVAAGIEDARASIGRSGAFRDVEFHRFPWERSFTVEEYVALLRTYSDHSTIPPGALEPLLEDVAATIEAAGGSVTRRYEAVLMLARPALTRP
jgi:SAM-dependent methyltransferase